MRRAVAIRLAVLVALLTWPSFFAWLSEVDEGRRAIWSTLHQVYYVPFGWVGPPLFTPVSDVGVLVHPTGRAFAVFFYVLWFYVIIRVIDRRRLARLHGKSKADVIRD